MSGVKSPSDPKEDSSSPSSLIPDAGHTNALMNRLQAFLPQMQAANQALSSENPQRVDLELESKNDDDDDDDDDESDNDNDNSDDDGDSTKKEKSVIAGENATSSHPTIQIEFAMGKMKENPIIQLLANDGSDGGSDNDDDSDDDNDDISSEMGKGSTRKRAVAKLLGRDDDSSKRRLQEPPSNKKPLITEL